MKRLHLCDGHDPNQVGIILRTLQQIWDTELWTQGRPVSLCWNIYTSYLSVTLANSLTPEVCQRKGKGKSCRETLIFMLNFMFERTFLNCYSWLCAATGKEVHEKCSGKYVLVNVLFGRQNLCWRGGKRKKYLFLPKKYQSTFPLGRGKINIFFTIFNILL